jgi:type IV pilus assembly protein PilE
MGAMNIQPMPLLATAALGRRRVTNARRNGFTLIELMIVVVVLAIITAIAYPSYTSYVRKARRATAQAALMDIGAKQQAYLLDRRTYTDDLAAMGFTAPQEINGYYGITVFPVSPTTFTVTAKPTVGSAQAKDGELDLTLNQSGDREPKGKAGYWGQ